MKKTVAIIHYNTPELTEAAILSLRKHGGGDYQVVVFDNSDRHPWKKRMKGVRRIDNTKGKYIDFNAELAKFPDKCLEYNRVAKFGSVKHMMSVQKLWELIPGGFILLESDVLISQPIDFLWDEQYAAAGKVQYFRGRRMEADRLLPMLCYMNVPLLTANGARYFDPQRSWGLVPHSRKEYLWYDTGACLLDDIRKTKPALICRCYPNLNDCYVHFGNASWRKNDYGEHLKWLKRYSKLWLPDE